MLGLRTRYQIWERLPLDDRYFNWGDVDYFSPDDAREDLQVMREEDENAFSDYKIVKVTYEDIEEFLHHAE